MDSGFRTSFSTRYTSIRDIIGTDVTTSFLESLVSPTRTIFNLSTGSEAPCIQTPPILQVSRTSCLVWKHARSLCQTIRFCRAQVIDCPLALEDQLSWPPSFLETAEQTVLETRRLVSFVIMELLHVSGSTRKDTWLGATSISLVQQIGFDSG